MSLKIDILKRLKELMGQFAQEDPSEKTWTPDELKVSEDAVGGKVELIQPDGTLGEAPDGLYKMQSGETYEVKGGLIASITNADGEKMEDQSEEDMTEEEKKKKGTPAPEKEGPVVLAEEGSPAEEASETPAQEEAEDAQEDQDVADLKNRVAALEQTLSQLVDQLNGSATKDEVNNFSKQLEALNNNIQILAKIPVEFSKTNNSNKVVDKKEQGLVELAKIVGSFKK